MKTISSYLLKAVVALSLGWGSFLPHTSLAESSTSTASSYQEGDDREKLVEPLRDYVNILLELNLSLNKFLIDSENRANTGSLIDDKEFINIALAYYEEIKVLVKGFYSLYGEHLEIGYNNGESKSARYLTVLQSCFNDINKILENIDSAKQSVFVERIFQIRIAIQTNLSNTPKEND